MADEITKIQVTIRRFLYEVRGVRHEASEAGKWLDRFCTTLEFQDLDPDPEAYASSLIDEARKYSEVKRYAARVRIAKAELVKEGTKRPTRQQIEERLKEIYAEEEITAAAATSDGVVKEDGHQATKAEASTAATDSGDGGVSPEVGCQASSLPSPTPIKTDPKPTRKAKAGVNPEKQKYPHGEFENIMLTTEEYIKLCERLENADELINEADQYFEAQPDKAKKYKSHYAMLLSWDRRRKETERSKRGYKTAAEKQRDELQKIADYYASKEVVG
jgi:hypothetical protein